MITYLDNEHIYLNGNGVIIPSVTDLVSFKFTGTYDNVPKSILKSKAEFGTQVHKAIETELLTPTKRQRLSPMVKNSLQEFRILASKWAFKPKHIEHMVSYQDRYAGRLDLITKDDVIVDYKTTADIYLDKWSWQLGYYNLAYGGKNTKGYVIWLPKGKRGQVLEVHYPSKEELLENLKNYEKYHTN